MSCNLDSRNCRASWDVRSKHRTQGHKHAADQHLRSCLLALLQQHEDNLELQPTKASPNGEYMKTLMERINTSSRAKLLLRHLLKFYKGAGCILCGVPLLPILSDLGNFSGLRICWQLAGCSLFHDCLTATGPEAHCCYKTATRPDGLEPHASGTWWFQYGFRHSSCTTGRALSVLPLLSSRTSANVLVKRGAHGFANKICARNLSKCPANAGFAESSEGGTRRA